VDCSKILPEEAGKSIRKSEAAKGGSGMLEIELIVARDWLMARHDRATRTACL
jgi:hypothetical protein